MRGAGGVRSERPHAVAFREAMGIGPSRLKWWWRRLEQYSEEQIIGALQEADAGVKVEDVCRRLGISKVTLYRWMAKFSGMHVGDARRLRQLEDENPRLKQMVADQALDIQALEAVTRRM